MQIRVYYEDTDVGGIVYHANYLKFCERVRSEAFFKRGLMPYNENGHFFIKNLQAEYFKSAYLGDLLDVETKLLKMGAASFELRQSVMRKTEKLFLLDVTLVYVGVDGKIKRLNKRERTLIEEMFG